MDNFILLPKPYLRRSIPSEKIAIDLKVSAELRRILTLLPIKKTDIGIQHDFDLHKITEPNLSNFNPLGNISKKAKIEHVSEATMPNKKEKANQTKNVKMGSSKSLRSDTISNIPTGNISIGYNCPLTFSSTLDYERIIGTVFSTFVWYFVPPDVNGDYNVLNDGIALGIYSKHKDVLTTKEVVKWHWDTSIYNNLNYPTVKFKIAVLRYDDNMPGSSALSDEIIANFGLSPCINIHSMNLSTTNSNGGYPSIKGGDHGTEPILNVYLNSPASPDGQVVYVSIAEVSNINPSAWINAGMGQFTIPGGQTFGQCSGIVGSRKVMSTKDVHVRASINGVEGSCTLRITKN